MEMTIYMYSPQPTQPTGYSLQCALINTILRPNSSYINTSLKTIDKKLFSATHFQMNDPQVTPIFPVSADDDIDFDLLDCVPSGSGVNMIEDDELGEKSVIELSGTDSRITFFTNSNHALMVLHVNACNRFMSICIIVRDDSGDEKSIEISSKRSTLVIEKSICKLPLEIGDGWQRICLNINDLLFRTFGTRYDSCIEVTLTGGCKLSKLFFQWDDYPDPLLPTFLRVAKQLR